MNCSLSPGHTETDWGKGEEPTTIKYKNRELNAMSGVLCAHKSEQNTHNSNNINKNNSVHTNPLHRHHSTLFLFFFRFRSFMVLFFLSRFGSLLFTYTFRLKLLLLCVCWCVFPFFYFVLYFTKAPWHSRNEIALPNRMHLEASMFMCVQIHAFIHSSHTVHHGHMQAHANRTHTAKYRHTQCWLQMHHKF